MNGILRNQMECDSPKQVRQSDSILENLKSRKLHIEDQLKRVTDAIDALESNPEVSRILELVAKTNY